LLLSSFIDPRSETYRSNHAWMIAAIKRLRAELKRSTEGGGWKYNERHKA